MISNSNINSITIFDDRAKDIPFLTVIIPTYKRGKLLAQTLDSLISQTQMSFEVVLVDNDSENDGGLDDLVNNYRNKISIALFRNAENLGMFGNWDRGMLLSRTKWVTILHDDDLFSPSFIADTQYILDTYSNIQLLLSRSFTFYGEENPMSSSTQTTISEGVIKKIRIAMLQNRLYRLSIIDYFFKNEHLGTLGAVFKRSHALNLNGFTNEHGPVSDYSFFIRYCKKYKGIYLYSCYLSFYRFYVNESLKYGVLLDFIDKCKIIRTEMLESYGMNSFIGKKLNSVVTAYQIRGIKGVARSNEFVDKLVKELLMLHGFSIFSYTIYQYIGRALYNFLQVKRFLSRRVYCPQIKKNRVT